MKRVFAFIGFTVAITLFLLLHIDFRAVPVIALFILVFLLLSLLFKSVRQGRVIPLVLASALFACAVLIVTMYSSVMPQLALDGKSAHAEVCIVDIPEKSDSGVYIYRLRTRSVERENAVQNMSLRAYSYTELDADYYEYIDCDLTFSAPYSSAFDSYGAYARGEYLTCGISNAVSTGQYSLNPLRYIVKLRTAVINTLLNDFGDECGGLAISLVTGNKAYVSNKVYNDFKVSGVSHAMAVSGLHIGLAYLAVTILLKPFYKRKILRSVLSGLFVFAYIGVADFSKSALRAGIMIAVFLIADAAKRPADNLNSLGIAAFIICLNPFAVTDAGALLTVSAMLGVLVIYPHLLSFCSVKNKCAQYFISGVLVSFSAVLATFPVGWLLFGYLSLAGILLNIIFIPLVQLAVLSLLFFLLLHPVGPAAAVLALLSRLALRAMLFLTDFTASRFYFAYLDFTGSYTGVAVGLLLIFIGILLVVFKRLNIKAVISVCLAVLISAYFFGVYEARSSAHMVVTGSGCVMIYDNDDLIVLDESRGDRYLTDSLSDGRQLVRLDSGDFDSFTREGFVRLCNEGENIYLYIYNYRFEISDDCVTIDGIRIERNVKRRFSSDDTVTVAVREGHELMIEKREG